MCVCEHMLSCTKICDMKSKKQNANADFRESQMLDDNLVLKTEGQKKYAKRSNVTHFSNIHSKAEYEFFPYPYI